MSACTSVCLSVCLVCVLIAPVCLSICTSVHTSVYLSVYTSVCLPVVDCCVCVCVQEPATTATGSPTTVYNASSSSSARKLLQSTSNVTATFGYTTSQAVASTFQSTFNTSQFNQALSVQGTQSAPVCLVALFHPKSSILAQKRHSYAENLNSETSWDS